MFRFIQKTKNPKLKEVLIVITAILCLASCQPDNRVEIIEDGVMIEMYEIDEDSLRHGVTHKFYSEGKPYEKSLYVHGKLDGERLLYYESGVIEIRERHCMGMFCDTLTTYYPSGSKKFEGVYNHGILSGMVRVYYESGELKEEVSFINNIEQGPFTEYHENGAVKWKGTYLNGPNEFGELEEYNESGEKVRVMECDTIAVCRTIWEIDSDQ